MSVPKCKECEQHIRIKSTGGRYSHNCVRLNLRDIASQTTVHGSPKWCPKRVVKGIGGEAMKDYCPKCKSENVTITDDFYEDENGIMQECGDRWSGHCNDCGWDYVLY